MKTAPTQQRLYFNTIIIQSFLTVYDILIYFKHTRGHHDESLPFLKTRRITNCCAVLANMKCVKQILLQMPVIVRQLVSGKK